MKSKTCNRCLEEKDIFNFSVEKRSKSGYQTRCKGCQAEVKKEMSQYYREKHLQAKYGISHEEYLEMLEEQHHSCAICKIREEHAENSRLCVDHDHNSGVIRKLLCKKCNQAIGLLQDNADFCASAADYLRQHK